MTFPNQPPPFWVFVLYGLSAGVVLLLIIHLVWLLS